MAPSPLPDTDDIIESLLKEHPDLSRLETVAELRKHSAYSLGECRQRVESFLERRPEYITPRRVPSSREPHSPFLVAGGCAMMVALVVVFVKMLFTPPPAEAAKPGGGGDAVWFVLAALAIAPVANEVRQRRFLATLSVYLGIRPRVVAENAGVLAAVVAAALGLRYALPFLDRSWLYLLPGMPAGGMNVLMAPLHWRFPGIVFLLALIPVLPRFAAAEERQYREGTRNWRHGAFRSLRFGLAHCWAGVPIYAALALGVGGLWFTHQYFRGGVARSTLRHATYNLIIVVLSLAFLVIGG